MLLYSVLQLQKAYTEKFIVESLCGVMVTVRRQEQLNKIANKGFH